MCKILLIFVILNYNKLLRHFIISGIVKDKNEVIKIINIKMSRIEEEKQQSEEEAQEE